MPKDKENARFVRQQTQRRSKISKSGKPKGEEGERRRFIF